ncbi:uncharacterized protein LOC114308662 [Camellia sinensis]|uniref:uncharacterized protein LOC114308662 n=1 Tax=Camellia sinensis TaxID=4442 RepID=UPI001035BECC|nr:uncharacterized protein LOC114308662 [Camellia sinensis]
MVNTNARNVDESESSNARIDRLERMVEALTRLVRQQQEQNQQQQRQPFPPPPPPPVQMEPINNDDVITLTQKYKKLKPPEFAGGIEPLKAEAWVLETEKIFEVFPCTDVYKVLLATFALTEEARRWWMLVRGENRDLTWDRFKETFYEKYFPQCMRDRKISEFEQLKQGTLSVAEYESKFTELARYAPHMVDTNYKKARKFEGGLHVEVLDRVNVLKLEKYIDVLYRALMAETNITALKTSKLTTMTEAESKKFKKQKVETISESVASVNENLNSSFSDNTTKGSNGSVGRPTCRECGKQHWGTCRRGTGVCFKCGQKGHIAKACPQVYSRNERPIASGVNSTMTPKTTVTSTPEGNTLRQGRVFTLVSEKTQNIGKANTGQEAKTVQPVLETHCE